MSEAELKKLEELKKMKKAGGFKKAEPKPDMDLPKIKADSLPPVMMGRKGQFEMIPDFLQKKAVQKDLTSLGEMDMMQAALNKQDEANADSGLSMKELFEKKRLEAEKALAEKQSSGPSKSEVEERKARLLAQRDLLRKQKEEKRQEELALFQKKTETKEDLFAELKKMDAKVNEEAENAKRKEMFRKAREAAEAETKKENEAKYEKKVDEIKKKEEAGDDWLDNIKTFGVNE